ncbi:hypothetical protein E2C01_046701 [Portunus trituberculatus]|uniref:Uncharacterized protein n=1 Tax=Portunus trituberculatus TaxID=210409 RepID=A0A5B7G1P0_PORTR|nr:hypothetical protein [Portunus trituberculatus]
MVPASTAGPTGGFYAPVPWTVAAPLPRIRKLASAIQLSRLVARLLSRILMVVSAIQLPCLVASLLSPPVVLSMVQLSNYSGYEVSICHTAPRPGGQTPFQDVEAAICHTAPMPGGQLIIPSRGLGLDETIPLSSVEASVVAGQPAPVPGGSGVSQGLSAPMPVGHPLSTAGTFDDDEEEVPPNQDVSPFLHLICQVKAYLHQPSPEAPSLSQLMGVKKVQGSVLPCQPSLSHCRLWLKMFVRKPNAGP